MKGIIFTEFLEMVEQIIDASQLPSGGSYTSLSTYDHNEILSLVTQLGSVSDANLGDLQLVFGEYLFSRFALLYGHFMDGVPNILDFIEKMEGYIHLEIQKLYPETITSPFCTASA